MTLNRTRPVTTPSVSPSHDLSPPFVPLEHAYAAYDASLTYASDDVVLFWHPPSAFSQWTLSPLTVDLDEYNCAEQFMMASKARLFGDDTALSTILATKDLREQKRLGRHVRLFDPELWRSECEHIVLHCNLAKFSQNEEMRLTLIQTGDRRLAEASPHDTLWGIGLSAREPRASSPDSWCGQNLLGQALENAREILRRDIPVPLSNPTPETPVHRAAGDTVFEVDPVTHLRLVTNPLPANTQSAMLFAFTASVPDDHAPEVFLAQEQRIDAPLIPEQGPDMIGGVVTMDDATFTTLLSLHSGGSATSRLNCRALLDPGSPQSFIHQEAFDQMVALGAADASCVRSTTPRTWSGFGSRQLLSTNQQARMTVQFHHNGTTAASLAVWMYIVPNKTMRCPLLLGRDSWMHFPSRSYQTLPPHPDGRTFGELTLSPCEDNLGSAAAYICNREASDNAYHLVFDGLGVSLTDSPQLIPVNLFRLDGSPALTGHYMVDLLPVNDDSYSLERFVSSGRQLIPLTGYQDLEPGDILGTASSPLVRVSLEALSLHDALADVSALAESPTPPSTKPVLPPNITSDSSDEPPPELLVRLDPSQRESLLRLRNTVPPHIRRINFALDAAGWDPAALDALSTTLTTYADVFSSSKLDYGECSQQPFEIKVLPGTQPIQSRPSRLNLVLSKQADAILDSYLAAGFIQHSTSPWSSPLVYVPKKSGGIRITVNYQKLNKVTEIPQISIPRVDEVLDTLGGSSVFSVFDLFSGFT